MKIDKSFLFSAKTSGQLRTDKLISQTEAMNSQITELNKQNEQYLSQGYLQTRNMLIR